MEHLRRGVPALSEALEAGLVATHPFVIGELACGHIARRDAFLDDLARLPGAPEAEHDEVMALVKARRLAGRGLGWIDAHLLASARLAGMQLWTLDAALRNAWLDSGTPKP
ncbi:MAG: hypothetical protein KF689_01220 [Gemmatimonadaceae bacterium]|nr:hypothetical protein [Gemmatimonadaceae bacterium]MCW5826551.1 hypothetical protein [Gemmatimonadaceae bacterium]